MSKKENLHEKRHYGKDEVYEKRKTKVFFCVKIVIMAEQKTKQQLIYDLQSKVKGLIVLLDTIQKFDLESVERIEISRTIATNLRSIFAKDKINEYKNLIERCGFDSKLIFPLYGYYSLNLVPTYQLLSFSINNNKIFPIVSDDVAKPNVVWTAYLSFSLWLNETIMDTKLSNVEPISRFLAIKIISDKEGAHVDNEIDQRLYNMSQKDILPVYVENNHPNAEIKAKSIFCETIIAIAKEFVFAYENYQNNKIELIGPSRMDGIIQVFKTNNSNYEVYKFGIASREIEEHSYNSNSFYKCEIYRKRANVFKIKQGKMSYNSIVIYDDLLKEGDYLGSFIYGK